MHAPNVPQIRLYQDWLRDQRALRFESCDALWQWSITELDAPLAGRIRDAIKTALSPRFVPDEILQAREIPRALSGKKQEVPIKKAFLGQPLDKVVNRDAMANPQCLEWYAEKTAKHLSRGVSSSPGCNPGMGGGAKARSRIASGLRDHRPTCAK